MCEVSIPYKYSRFLEASHISPFLDNQFEILYYSYICKSKHSIEPPQNSPFIYIKIIYKHINDAYKNHDSNKMYDLLGVLIEFSKNKPLLFSLDFLKYNILTILYSCLHNDSPPHLIIKTLELITQILKQEEKPLGESLVSNTNSPSLIKLLFDLAIYCVNSIKNGSLNSLEQNVLGFIILIRTIVCVNQIVVFNSEEFEFVLSLFFKESPYLIQELLRLNFFDSNFDPLLEFLKLYCCQLICTLTEANISRNDGQNLLKFICSNWLFVFKDRENLIKTEKIGLSLKNLVLAIYKLMNVIPDNWVDIFVQNGAWYLIESCLVVDNALLAVPAVNCVIQLLAQNVDIKVDFNYFIKLILAHDQMPQNENFSITHPIENTQTVENENAINLAKQIQSVNLDILPTQTEKEKETELVSLSCWAIERMVMINHNFAQEFVKLGIFDAIRNAVRFYYFDIQSQCLNCICSIIHHFTSGFELLLQSNTIELLVEFSQVTICDITLLRIITILNDIFQMSIVSGKQEETIRRFEEADGVAAIAENTNSEDQKINKNLDRLLYLYNSIQKKNDV